MNDFEYQAKTAEGEHVAGRHAAENEAAARQELSARGLVEVELRPVPAANKPAADKPPTEKTPPLNEPQLATLVEAVGAAASSRVPLDVTLAALAEEKDDPRLAAVAGSLAAQLREGVSIDEAVTKVGQDLPAEVRGLLEAGLESGDLAGTFEHFAEQRLALQRIRGTIRMATAYPLLIVSILVPMLLFLSLYVIPIFRNIFEDFGLDLPMLTDLVIQTSDQVPRLIGGVLLLVVAIPIVLRLVGGRWLFHRVRAATPLVGKLWNWSGQREFSALLASFLELRLPLASAVRHTGQVISDRNVARACRRVIERLNAGQSLGDSLSQSIHFDRALTSLAAWGEKHGTLPDALRIATDVFDDHVQQQASLVRRLLPPLALVTVATIVFLVAFALISPLVRLIEGLSI